MIKDFIHITHFSASWNTLNVTFNKVSLLLNTHAHTQTLFSFIHIYLQFYRHPPTSCTQKPHADIHTHQNIPFSEFQVGSSMATIHWPQSPWQQASSLLTLFLTDQFPLCLMCLSLYISLWFFSFYPFSKTTHLPLILDSLSTSPEIKPLTIQQQATCW